MKCNSDYNDNIMTFCVSVMTILGLFVCL